MISYAEAQGVISGDAKWTHICNLIDTFNSSIEAQQRTKKDEKKTTTTDGKETTA